MNTNQEHTVNAALQVIPSLFECSASHATLRLKIELEAQDRHKPKPRSYVKAEVKIHSIRAIPLGTDHC